MKLIINGITKSYGSTLALNLARLPIPPHPQKLIARKLSHYITRV